MASFTYKKLILDDRIGEHLDGFGHGAAGAIRVLLLLELASQCGRIAEAMEQLVPLPHRQRTGRGAGMAQQGRIATVGGGYGAGVGIEILRLVLSRCSQRAVRVDLLYEIVLRLRILAGYDAGRMRGVCGLQRCLRR